MLLCKKRVERKVWGLNCAVLYILYISFKKLFEEYFDKMLTSVKSGSWDMGPVIFFFFYIFLYDIYHNLNENKIVEHL